MPQKKKKGSKPVKKDLEKIKAQEEKDKRLSIIMIIVFAVVIIGCLVLLLVFAVPQDDSSVNTTGNTTSQPEQIASTNIESSEEDISFVSIDESKTYTAEIKVKDYGTIKVALDQKAAPITVKNFVTLVQSGFYDGLTFHRIMEGFMMQGGDPKGDGTGGAEHTIKGEFAQNGYTNPISHTRGTISMARSSLSMDSASSQFFIVQTDDYTATLDDNYAAFGHVTEGMDIVDKICADAKPTDDNGTIKKEEQPVIESIRIL